MYKKELLNKTRAQIEICKKNVIENIEKEAIVPATGDLLMLRDLKAQELLLKSQIKQDEEEQK